MLSRIPHKNRTRVFAALFLLVIALWLHSYWKNARRGLLERIQHRRVRQERQLRVRLSIEIRRPPACTLCSLRQLPHSPPHHQDLIWSGAIEGFERIRRKLAGITLHHGAALALGARLSPLFKFGGFELAKPNDVIQASFPLWALALLLSFPLAKAIYAAWCNRHRYSEGMCQKCGDDLCATPHRCPECGTIPSPRVPGSSSVVPGPTGV